MDTQDKPSQRDKRLEAEHDPVGIRNRALLGRAVRK
jgi:hypothetical protein